MQKITNPDTITPHHFGYYKIFFENQWIDKWAENKGDIRWLKIFCSKGWLYSQEPVKKKTKQETLELF